MNLTVFATQLLLLYVMSCKLPKDRWCNWIDKYRPFLLIFRLRKMLVSKNFKIKVMITDLNPVLQREKEADDFEYKGTSDILILFQLVRPL